MSLDLESIFVGKAPSNQNIIDIFDGEWSSTMPPEASAHATPGHAALFADPRLSWAHDVLGPFTDKQILELGPLEGAHTYMLEKFGAASITAVEANTRAFLKCLCVKEVMNLSRAHFMLGSFIPFLETCQPYDFIIASGVLYHMTDPVYLLQLLMQRSNGFMLWTHYYEAEALRGQSDEIKFMPPTRLGDTQYVGSKRIYPDVSLAWKGFSGGLESYAIWLTKASLLECLDNGGFDVQINFDQPDHPNGPSLALCATRRVA
jgi:hypothetical protein